jgi:putative membrane protein
MLWLKAFHIIAVICWFAGLFYLPRLMVYHVTAKDKISNDRFKIMERRLYYGIMWPSAILTTVFGIGLICFNSSYYLQVSWMHLKLALVFILWVYHLYLGHCRKNFLGESNKRSEKFYRILNEIPTILLVGIIILVVVKPQF